MFKDSLEDQYHPDYYKNLNKIGLAYYEFKKFSEAKNCYQESLQIQESLGEYKDKIIYLDTLYKLI